MTDSKDPTPQAPEPGDNLDGPDVPIVALGASAGGIKALESFLSNCPADPGAAFVVLLHQHAQHATMLPEILARATDLPIEVIEHGTEVRGNRVFVAPPGAYVELDESVFSLKSDRTSAHERFIVDVFMRSLAATRGRRSVGVVLSGTGSDGTLGLQAIRAASGLTTAQDPESAEYPGMPEHAIRAGNVDFVLGPADLAAEIVDYVARGASPAVTAREPAMDSAELEALLAEVERHTGNDFSAYKRSTLQRRIARRMDVHHVEDLADYRRFADQHPQEYAALFKELLVTVSSFFRDQPAFEMLRDQVLPEQLDALVEGETVRVWIPGCATGEEAYSVAIVLRECMDQRGRSAPVSIFATDLDSDALDVARRALYPAAIGQDVGSERLARYFVQHNEHYRVRPDVREMVVFAEQNLICDPPFMRMHLIVCRNVLIYMNAELQARIIPMFHYALRPGGSLFLGPSETVGRFDNLFEPVDRRWKLYRRRDTPLPLNILTELPGQRGVPREGPVVRAKRDRLGAAASGRQAQLAQQAQALLLRRFAPASVLVDDKGDIFYVHGRTGAYLEPSAGQPSVNVLDMAREGLQLPLHAALGQAVRQQSPAPEPMVHRDIQVKTNGDVERIDLVVAPLTEPPVLAGLFLVAFHPAEAEEAEPGEAARSEAAEAGHVGHVQQLEQALAQTRERLQATEEEWQTSNEELRSSNEELQSTNEELETSQEELQSLNEELHTVNEELERKVEALSEATDDMANLINSIDVAILFLDRELRIRRYTEPATRLVNLIDSDVGRPLGDLVHQLHYNDLLEDCRQVLRTLVTFECEIQSDDVHWYRVRIVPYRTSEDLIAGVVLTFIDIDELKRAQQRSEAAKERAEAITDTVREPLLVLDPDLRAISANRSFCSTFDLSPEQVTGTPIYELDGGQWDIPELRRLLEEVLPQDTSFEGLVVDHEFPRVGRQRLSLNGRRLQQNASEGPHILLAMTPVRHENADGA